MQRRADHVDGFPRTPYPVETEDSASKALRIPGAGPAFPAPPMGTQSRWNSRFPEPLGSIVYRRILPRTTATQEISKSPFHAGFEIRTPDSSGH